MHMTCKQCKHEFCWLCLEDWKIHGSSTGGYYKCNRYVEKKEEKSQLNVKQQQLKKYTWYSDRFTEHKKSVQMAITKKNNFLSNLQRYFEVVNNNSREEIFSLALELIIECRRAIAYSYCVGYYLQIEEKREYFEFLQQEVEHQLENLDKQTDLSTFNCFYDEQFNCLTEQYYEFAEKINQKSKILLKYFENIMYQLEMDLPEVAVETKVLLLKKQSSIYDPNESDSIWLCMKCTYANENNLKKCAMCNTCLLYTSPSPRDRQKSRMPSSA
eukprot:TRINITY_DN991_c0_g1_i1.p3 TRINITY_DN991_c0_g1~~TRINITY_DN991_c0_g1_i1.p3  ORF type:complete len:271 (-),score=62.21 TRINITY_DN991_c0_g1_i1:52-864(-)